jgi:hypothetical protein
MMILPIIIADGNGNVRECISYKTLSVTSTGDFRRLWWHMHPRRVLAAVDFHIKPDAKNLLLPRISYEEIEREELL